MEKHRSHDSPTDTPRQHDRSTDKLETSQSGHYKSHRNKDHIPKHSPTRKYEIPPRFQQEAASQCHTDSHMNTFQSRDEKHDHTLQKHNNNYVPPPRFNKSRTFTNKSNRRSPENDEHSTYGRDEHRYKVSEQSTLEKDDYHKLLSRHTTYDKDEHRNKTSSPQFSHSRNKNSSTDKTSHTRVSPIGNIPHKRNSPTVHNFHSRNSPSLNTPYHKDSPELITSQNNANIPAASSPLSFRKNTNVTKNINHHRNSPNSAMAEGCHRNNSNENNCDSLRSGFREEDLDLANLPQISPSKVEFVKILNKVSTMYDDMKYRFFL